MSLAEAATTPSATPSAAPSTTAPPDELHTLGDALRFVFSMNFLKAALFGERHRCTLRYTHADYRV